MCSAFCVQCSVFSVLCSAFCSAFCFQHYVFINTLYVLHPRFDMYDSYTSNVADVKAAATQVPILMKLPIVTKSISSTVSIQTAGAQDGGGGGGGRGAGP